MERGEVDATELGEPFAQAARIDTGVVVRPRCTGARTGRRIRAARGRRRRDDLAVLRLLLLVRGGRAVVLAARPLESRIEVVEELDAVFGLVDDLVGIGETALIEGTLRAVDLALLLLDLGVALVLRRGAHALLGILEILVEVLAAHEDVAGIRADLLRVFADFVVAEPARVGKDVKEVLLVLVRDVGIVQHRPHLVQLLRGEGLVRGLFLVLAEERILAHGQPFFDAIVSALTCSPFS